MKTNLLLGSLFAGMLLVSAAQAGEVVVKDTHLCCGACLKAVGNALGKVDGVSGAKCDKEAKTVTFTAANEEAAQNGMRALSRAGFYGKATVDGKEAKFPGGTGKKGEKSNKLVLRGLHLCCGQCVKAAEAAAKEVDGVESVAVDKEARTVTLSGKDIETTAAVAALHKAGFAARTGRGKKKGN